MIQGELFSITYTKLYNKKVVLERKALGSKTVTILVADLSTILDNMKVRDGAEVITVEPLEIYKWDKTEDVKGELLISESEIIKCSESDGIIVNSFWY